jgi:hypothetical protein
MNFVGPIPLLDGIELSDELLASIVGGVLDAEGKAYCETSVGFYHNRGYTLESMRSEMLAYQQQLRDRGDTALADLSAEYLEYMVSIW